MNHINPSSIKSYLASRGISFREANGELIMKCFFSDCDHDSRGNEAHLYIEASSGQFHCFKCQQNGNLKNICEQLGDKFKDIFTSPVTRSQSSPKKLDALIMSCHENMPQRITEWLNQRGITDEIIQECYLGYGHFYNKPYITIPVKNTKGVFAYLKLRRDPLDQSNASKYAYYPTGAEAQLFGRELLSELSDFAVITEGELDALALRARGIPAVSSTSGAGTFKAEWLNDFAHLQKVFVCYDRDPAGRKGADKVLEIVTGIDISTYRIELPDLGDDSKDVTDYLIKHNIPQEDLITKYALEYPERIPIDTTQFSPLSLNELIEILGLTIKYDQENKLLTFLGQLSAFTESSQLNLSFNAPSSTGKSYLPLEVAAYFPNKDVIKIAHCSPTAFFHEVGRYDAKANEIIIDLSRKILIFLDQPHYQLLSNLRPLLSKDEKEIHIKITDKNQKGGNRTKNIRLIGFPAVTFCTANIEYDEQEATRMIVLSPETSQEKLREGVGVVIAREADWDLYVEQLEASEPRKQLRLRVAAIRDERIEYIRLGVSTDKVKELFYARHKILKPRHQRDIKKILSVTKSLALMNCWWRDKEGTTITANEEDLVMAFEIWDNIADSQELDLPPFVYKLFTEIIEPLWNEKNKDQSALIETPAVGISRKEVMQRHLKTYGRPIKETFLRQQVLPALENAGLISQSSDPDKKDGRVKYIYLDKEVENQPAGIEEPSILEASFDDLIAQASGEEIDDEASQKMVRTTPPPMDF